MPNAYGYIRCSHIDTLNHGHTLKMQKEKIQQHFKHILQPKHPELSLGGIFEEQAVSAYKFYLFARPAGMKLNQALQKGDHVIFPMLDRAFRRRRDLDNTLIEWKARGIFCHFLDFQIDTSTPFGEAFLYMRGIFAELESAITSTRHKEVAAWKRSLGIKGDQGRHPRNGFIRLPNGKLKPDPVKRAYMGYMLQLIEVKGMKCGEVSRFLNEKSQHDIEQRKVLGILNRWRVRDFYNREKLLRAEEGPRRAALAAHVAGINGTAHTLAPHTSDTTPSLAQTPPHP